tara:strand:- start:1360 stop:1731 length:372 start_codon:yes stop_codon:yes gene_type:complete
VSEQEGNVAERLMSALISKMETMDAGLRDLQAENKELKKMVSNPSAMLRKAGFVSATTQRPQDVVVDGFRGEIEDTILKGQDGSEISMPQTNADFHSMDWSDIHALAEQAKGAGAIGNNTGMD